MTSNNVDITYGLTAHDMDSMASIKNDTAVTIDTPINHVPNVCSLSLRAVSIRGERSCMTMICRKHKS